jgi:hypothetical protein
LKNSKSFKEQSLGGITLNYHKQWFIWDKLNLICLSEAEMVCVLIKKILEYLKDFQLCQTKMELKTSY